MRIEFYRSGAGRSPVEEFIEGLGKQDQARFLDVILGIGRFGFACPRVEFRQLRGKLWEVKFRAETVGYRVAYVTIRGGVMVWLHAFKKKTQKTPIDDIDLATKRMKEVLSE